MNQNDNAESGEAVRYSALLGDVERLRVQLAGCGVAALDGSEGQEAKPFQYGWSPAYADVLALRRKYDVLHALVSELSQLVWEHHSSAIMRPNVCPACSDEKWSKVLDMARGVKSHNI